MKNYIRKSSTPQGLNKLLIEITRIGKVKVADVRGSCRRNHLVAVRALFARVAIEKGYYPEDIAEVLHRYPSAVYRYYKDFTPSQEYINIKERYERIEDNA